VRFTIKLKLALGFGAIILLTGVAAWVGTSSLASIEESFKSLLSGPVSRMAKISDIQVTFLNMQRYDKNLILATEPNEIELFEEASKQARQDLSKQLDEYSRIVSTADKDKLAEIQQLVAQYFPLQDKMIEFGRRDTAAEARQTSETAGQADELIATLRQLHERLAARAPTVEVQSASAVTFEILQQLQELRIGERNLMLASTEAETGLFQQKLSAALSSILRQREALRRLADAQDRATAEQFFERFEKWLVQHERVIALAAGNTKMRAAGLSRGEGRKIASGVRKQIDAMNETIRKAFDDAKANAESVYNSAKQALVAAVAVAILIGLASAIWMAASIGRGLGRAVGLANRVALGDLSREAAVNGNDEIGDLIGALDRMTANLRATAKVAGAIAQGDLSVEVKPLSDKDTLGLALKDMVENLRAIASDALMASGNVSSGSQELSASAEQLSSGATEQAAAAEQASASMEQMASNIRQTADNASQTEKIARQSAADAEASGQAVVRAVEAMQTIAGKITIVQEIARQTDLLALNAAVEASRAGEHGRGFAVVASEVRKLAERSRAAAQEISALSGQTVPVAQQAGERLSRLVPSIKKTAQLVEEISVACREQDVGADQVNQAIQQLDKVIQQNASASEQMSATSEELASQAEQLQESISFFRIAGGQGQGDGAGEVAGAAAAAKLDAGHIPAGKPARAKQPLYKERDPGTSAGAPNGAAHDLNGQGAGFGRC
jgi:methyl-accepting chemotaxis protein